MRFREKNCESATSFNLLITMSLVLLLSPLMIAAQAVSSITGVVTDPSGAVIPGAQVTLLDTKTNRELTTTTSDDGVYIFNNIQPGDGFKLSVSKTSFQTVVLNNVQLGIGRTESQDVTLTPGEVSVTVDVISTTGDATLNTTDASVGNVIGQRQLRELPIQIRSSPAALLGLQPGAVGNNVGTADANRVGSVTGSRADQGNITVDGIDANDVTTGQAFATVANAPIDSVQEFRAVTANPTANEGRSSGAQIQLTTNSGTNEFSGSLREYYRDERTAANTFFNNRSGVARPGLRRHQFGGSLGGPLPFFNFGEGGPLFHSGKDKLFFFFDYEGRRDNSQSAASRTVPLQNFREGRIGYINNSAGCTLSSRQNTTPTCISYLSQAQTAALDPRGIGVNQPLLAFINSRYPQANDLTGGDGVNTGLFRFNAPVTRQDNIYTSRIDWNANSSHKVFGRATFTRRASTNALQQFPGDEDAVSFQDQSYALAFGHNWVISPNFFNQITAGLSKSVNIFSPADAASFPNSFNAGGVLTSPFASLSYQDRNVFVPTFRDDATWTKGAHTVQFGGQFKPIRQKPSLTNDFNFVTLGIGGGLSQLDATLRPSNILGTSSTVRGRYDSAFSYILGRYAAISTNFQLDTNGNAFAPGTGRSRSWAYDEYELYVQDAWRVRNDLTVNYGVRWHYYPAPYETNGFQTSNNIDYEELVKLRLANAAAGIAGPSAEPFLTYSLSGKANNGRAMYDPDYDNFAPRVSFNYSPSFRKGILGAVFGERNSSIRGGASMLYDRVGGAITFLTDQSTYIFDTNTVRNFGTANARASLLNDPRFTSLTSLPIQNVAPTVANPVTPFVRSGVGFGLSDSQTNYTVAKNFEIPYSYQWSLGFQRGLPGNFLLDVSYVGRLGRKLFTQSDAAQTLNFKDQASGQFMFAAFNAVQAQIEAGATLAQITAQPFIENQVNPTIIANYGGPCTAFGYANCTQLTADFFGDLYEVGGSGDLVQQLYLNRFIRPNVGISSQFATNAYVTNQGKSNYNGLLVSLQKRFSKGFEFDVNYTYSHSIDNGSSITNTVFGGLVCNIENPDVCRGDAAFDIRHLFNANGIWNLPVGRGQLIGKDMPSWLNAVLGGWTLSGIVTARTGLPLSAASGAFPLSFVNESPAILIGDRSAFKSDIRETGSGIQYFADPVAARAALRYPRHGELGSRNIFRGPGFWNLDAAVSKRFKMPWSENHTVTFRAEAYNLTNSVNFALPALGYGDPTTFGRITGTSNSPREFQFALRYDF